MSSSHKATSKFGSWMIKQPAKSQSKDYANDWKTMVVLYWWVTSTCSAAASMVAVNKQCDGVEIACLTNNKALKPYGTLKFIDAKAASLVSVAKTAGLGSKRAKTS